MNNRIYSGIFLSVIVLDLFVIALHLIFSQHLYLGVLFDLDQEANFPTWYTSFKLTLAGVLALLIYAKERSQTVHYNNIWMWLSIALLMFFMSADETAQIHETMTRWFMDTGAGNNFRENLDVGKTGGTLLWGLIFSPVLILIALAVMSFYLQRFKQHRPLLIMSVMMIALFVLSFILEQQQAHLAGQLNQITSGQFELYQLMALMEESAELFASSLLVYIHFYYHLEQRQLVQ